MHNGGDILDDCVSASDGGEPSSIQQQANMEWFYTPGIMAIDHLGMGHAMCQATSFGNYTQHMDGYQIQQQQQQYAAQLYSLSGGPHDFRGQPIHEQQHPAVMLQHTVSIPQSLYFGTSQDIQGVATMYAQVSRQQQDPVENLYFAPGMNEFIQSSRSGFSESGPYWLI
ncbi:c2h2 finger domain-containing protein [Colletotrichum tofieldiae]|nr:C2H2 finger domain-containing protein [Colletotrichum tofieldiae]GKT68894.1 c2h2 finger domain-containing protein [Colletotrichum tofieldiae]